MVTGWCGSGVCWYIIIQQRCAAQNVYIEDGTTIYNTERDQAQSRASPIPHLAGTQYGLAVRSLDVDTSSCGMGWEVFVEREIFLSVYNGTLCCVKPNELVCSYHLFATILHVE